MKIKLSDHFTMGRLLKFTLPTIVMMIFTSIYGIVDGIFVSRWVGKTPFAAVNFIMPFLMIFGSLGFMFGTGGSAVVSKTLGENDVPRAKRYFSMIVYSAIILGILLTVIGWCFLRPIASLLGAEGEMLENCVIYGRVIILALVPYVLQNVFQSFMVTAGKPQLGLGLTIAAGVTNMVLDFFFVAVFKWGLVGAASATAISQCVGGIIPLIYFLSKNGSSLTLVKTKPEWRVLGKAAVNGSSEMLTNISMSLVNMLYNYQLMKYIGEDGVSAYGVIMYINLIFTGVFIGYSIGSAPVVGYNYGSGNTDELKGIFKKSLSLITVSSVVLTGAALLLSSPLSQLFVGYDKGLFNITVHGFSIYSFAFLLMGFNIFGSSFFTALNNGFVSALISFFRTLVFQIAAVIALPLLLGLDGIWMSVVVAELCALAITVTALIVNRKKYKYA